jgi:prepilin-type N-terminal cleavage/methylation domain-containing protein
MRWWSNHLRLLAFRQSGHKMMQILLPAMHRPHSKSVTNTLTAFTLIELLVVIAIIAILAGLAFPAVQGALESGKKAQARNEVHQLAAAIKAFQLEYGRLPSTDTGEDQPADNATIIATLTRSNSLNPRGIIFFEPKMARQGRNGLDGSVYKDPWGNPYSFTLDTDYNNKIGTNFTTVIVTSPGAEAGKTNANSLISTQK